MPLKTISHFINREALSGLFLIASAILAMIIANSPFNNFYQDILHLDIIVKIGNFDIHKPLLLWVNDGLMAIFFFLIGLEIKREFLEGELSNKEQIFMPLIGAIGGVAVPAFIYYLFNQDNSIALHGWAIPTATDIAFSLGLLALLNKRVPLSLKVFLMTLAIFDDLSAIIFIAIFYTKKLSFYSLLLGLIPLSALIIMQYKRVTSTHLYVFAGMFLWAAFLKSGVHATLAGVVISMFIPMKGSDPKFSPLKHFEHTLQGLVNFFILPLFAFVNSGLVFKNIGINHLSHEITLGIFFGLFLGKQIGIFGSCSLAILFNLIKKPKEISFTQLYGVSVLCGVGFTMSLFIGSLAFDYTGKNFIALSQLGIFSGSLISAIVGMTVLYFSDQRK